MDIEDIIKHLKNKVAPNEDEIFLVNTTINKVVNKLNDEIKRRNINAKVEVHGSIAHDTWLPGDRDIDVFILFDPSVGKEKIVTEGLEIAKSAFPKYIERYAEHPFITAHVDGFLVDVVPAAMISDVSKLITAADRTPLHSRYLSSTLNDELKLHARILKLFMKNIGVYGAEIKVEGFSGYLVELLTVFYNGFPNFIKNAADWIPYKTVLPKEYENVFNDPLVVIDPVDPKRNVASAVNLENMSIVIQASRELLKRPSLKFFIPPKPRILKKSLITSLRKRGSHIVVIVANCPKVPPDILWGELKHSMKGIARLMENYEFRVVDSTCWSDENKIIALFYEVKELKLPKIKIVKGPPISMRDSCEQFIASHENVWIRDSTLYAYSQRNVTDLLTLLKNKIFAASLSRHIAEELKRGFEIYIDYQVLNLNGGLLIHAKKFIDKSLWWLKD
ncbi:MAG: CCA tRNA nucleotidyltransferase [Thermoprotei archaeon]